MQIWLYWSSWQFWKDLIRSDQKIDKVKNIMIYFNDYFIRNLIWSSLIHFDPFLTDLIQSDQKINKVENLIIYFNDYFIRNPIWSSLIHFDPFWSKNKYIKLRIWGYISMIISSEIKFDQVWSILIHFGQIWFNLVKKK